MSANKSLERSQLHAGLIKTRQWLDDRLYGGRPVVHRPYRRLATVISASSLIIVGIAVALVQIPFSQWGVVWAEDGAIFLNGAWSPETAFNLFQPYQGYLHVAPRLIALVLGNVLPASLVAVAFTVAASAVAALLGTFAFFAIRDRFHSVALAGLVWFAFVALPVNAIEAGGNLANLHWYFLAAGAIALLARRETRTLRWIGTVIVALAILSDPLGLLLIPLVIVRVVVHREPSRWTSAIVLGAAYALQWTFIVLAPLLGGARTIPGNQHPAPGEVFDLYLRRILEVNVIGTRGTRAVIDRIDPLDLYVVLILAVILMIALWIFGRQRIWVLTVFIMSLGFFVADEFLSWSGVSLTNLSLDTRYAVAPAILFMLAALQTIDQILLSLNRPKIRVVVVAVALLVAIAASATSFRSLDPRGWTPTFASQLNAARTHCSSPGQSSFNAYLAPGWTSPISCAGIRRR